ncbi:hypothetical protein GMRT_13071 [Giardia muris]|uniref:Uncharacterized protein n=1 Tax=Giardia muris TaxID=5742 RepID=A0A4Z1TCQ2_GIAMU|nr:hypothetical protein GMRT_13071 [Giardia muris]|eukprot:TNJ30369.1 hypothetical protein GMRT_13071 [Giardia muris]
MKTTQEKGQKRVSKDDSEQIRRVLRRMSEAERRLRIYWKLGFALIDITLAGLLYASADTYFSTLALGLAPTWVWSLIAAQLLMALFVLLNSHSHRVYWLAYTATLLYLVAGLLGLFDWMYEQQEEHILGLGIACIVSGVLTGIFDEASSKAARGAYELQCAVLDGSTVTTRLGK